MTHVSPHLIVAFFRLLAKMFPAPPLDWERYPTPETLTAANRRWSVSTGILFVVLFPASAYLVYHLAWQATNERTAPFSRALFLIRAEPVEICFWSIFLAAVLSGWLIFFSLRLALGRQLYRDFIMVSAHATPLARAEGLAMDMGKVFFLFLVVFGSPLAALLVLRVDSFTAFTETAMIHNPTWSYGRTIVHPYDAISGLYAVAGWHARFQDVAKPRHAIIFSDGTVWTTDEGMRGPRPAQDQAFIEEVGRRSHHPVIPVDFLEDVRK